MFRTRGQKFIKANYEHWIVYSTLWLIFVTENVTKACLFETFTVLLISERVLWREIWTLFSH